MQEENREGLDRLVDRYLESRSALNWSPRTIESYRSHLKVFTRYLAAETDVDGITAVTPAVLRRYQAFLYQWTDPHERGRSLATQGACSCPTRVAAAFRRRSGQSAVVSRRLRTIAGRVTGSNGHGSRWIGQTTPQRCAGLLA